MHRFMICMYIYTYSMCFMICMYTPNMFFRGQRARPKSHCTSQSHTIHTDSSCGSCPGLPSSLVGLIVFFVLLLGLKSHHLILLLHLLGDLLPLLPLPLPPPSSSLRMLRNNAESTENINVLQLFDQHSKSEVTTVFSFVAHCQISIQ